MHTRLAEIGLAGGIGGNFVANSLELAAANVFEVLPFGRGRGGFVKIDRDMEAPGDFGSDVAGHGDAVINGDAVDGDEGNHIGRAHARVRALMPGQVDQLGGLPHAANRRLLNGFGLADERDHASVVVSVHLPVEQIHAGDLHGFDDGIDLGCIAAFGEIGNAFNESVGHGRRIKSGGAGGQTGGRASGCQLPAFSLGCGWAGAVVCHPFCV